MNQKEFLELKKTMNDQKKKIVIEYVNIRMDHAEEIICEIEDRNFGVIQS